MLSGSLLKYSGLAVALACCMALPACNSVSNTTVSSNGTLWEATLLETTGSPSPYDFVTEFSIAANGALTFDGITFITNNPCFVSGATMAGQAALTVDTTTYAVTGTMNLAVQSGTPSGNALQLTGTEVTGTETDGTLSSGVVTGNWALTGGSGCTEAGTFTLRQQ